MRARPNRFLFIRTDRLTPDMRGCEQAKFELSVVLQSRATLSAAEKGHTLSDCFLSRFAPYRPHLVTLAKVVDGPEITRALANHCHTSTFERIAGNVRRFRLQHNWARRQIETKEGGSAAQRELLLLAERGRLEFAAGVPPFHSQDQRGLPTDQRRWSRT